MSSVQRVATWIVWLVRFTKGWLPQILASVSAIFAAIWGTYGPDFWGKGGWAFATAVVLAGLSIVTQVAFQQPSYMELSRLREESEKQSQLKSQAIEQSLTILLRKLAEYCDMASNSDRASVYYFHDGQFVMLSRWAESPTHAQRGRGKYPLGQGAIGDAWDKGFAVQSLPVGRTAWDKRLESKHGFPVGSAAKLNMHCQSIAALRIHDDHRAVGVIVLESLEGSRASLKTLDAVRTSLLFATLCELVGGVASLTPQIEEVVKAARGTSSTSVRVWKPAAKPVSSTMENA